MDRVVAEGALTSNEINRRSTDQAIGTRQASVSERPSPPPPAEHVVCRFRRQATKTEQTLLEMLPPSVSEDESHPAAGGGSPARTSSVGCDPKCGGMSAATQPPPFLLSRSHTSVELLPVPIPCQASQASTPDNVGDQSRLSRPHTSVSSNATSTRAAAATGKGGKMKTTQGVAKVSTHARFWCSGSSLLSLSPVVFKEAVESMFGFWCSSTVVTCRGLSSQPYSRTAV